MPDIESAIAEPIVDVVGLRRCFGARTAAANLSLAVAAGQVAGLIGANGGGKTTSLRLLAGLLAPDAGSGRVLGHDLRRPDRRIRGQVGYMAQRLALYPGISVLDNLRFRAEVYGVPNPRDAAQRAAAGYGLEPYARLPAERLSGGWARMAQLAAALIHGPRLVLLDEPTAGLDPAARQAVWQRITSLAGAGAAVVIATRDLAEAERCSHVSVLAGVVVMISALLLGALTLVRERERGTWETLRVTRVHALEVLLGKLAPYVLCGVLQAAGVVAVGHALFALLVRGSAAWLLVAAALLSAAHLTLGFALSALARTQVQAAQAAVLFYLPSMVLSGFMFPFEGMPRWAQALGQALPLTHFVRAARGLLLRGAGSAEIAAELCPVVLFRLAAAVLALVAYHRRLD